jgi:hypothetical protein
VVIFNVIGGAFQVWRDPRLGSALSALGIWRSRSRSRMCTAAGWPG